MVVVMRRAVFMEDEGRHSFVKAFTERADAERWIAAQKNEYFQPGDYYIAEGDK
jgi:hypothetical protein